MLGDGCVFWLQPKLVLSARPLMHGFFQSPGRIEVRAALTPKLDELPPVVDDQALHAQALLDYLVAAAFVHSGPPCTCRNRALFG